MKTTKTNSFSTSEVARRAVFSGCTDTPEPRSTAAFPFLTRTDTTHQIQVHEQFQQRGVKTGTASLLFWGGAPPTCTCSKMPRYPDSTRSAASERTEQLLSPPRHPAAAAAPCAGPAAGSSILSASAREAEQAWAPQKSRRMWAIPTEGNRGDSPLQGAQGVHLPPNAESLAG